MRLGAIQLEGEGDVPPLFPGLDAVTPLIELPPVQEETLLAFRCLGSAAANPDDGGEVGQDDENVDEVQTAETPDGRGWGGRRPAGSN